MNNRRAAICCVAAALSLPLARAQAQSSTATVIPPAPPIVATPLAPSLPTPPPPAAPPPGLVQTPAPPAVTGDANADTGSANQPVAPGAATAAAPAPAAADQPPPNPWVPGTTAKLGVLDKVDGGIDDLSIPVGGQTKSGDLQVSVLACVTRPPDTSPDAAVFISIQPSADQSGPPLFRGWLIRSAPAAAAAGDASVTFRVVGCS